MNEEKLHLCFGDPATEALAWTEPKSQTPEVVAFTSEPARGPVLIRMWKHPMITTHSIESQLYKCLIRTEQMQTAPKHLFLCFINIIIYISDQTHPSWDVVILNDNILSDVSL